MSIVWKKTPAGFTARLPTGLHDDAERVVSVWRTKRESCWRWTVRDGHNAILSKGIAVSAATAKMESVRPYNNMVEPEQSTAALKREVEILRSDLKLALDRESALNAKYSVLGATPSFETALVALNQLLTALHPGLWSPGVVLSYLAPTAERCTHVEPSPYLGQHYAGELCNCRRNTSHWYISLTKFVANGTITPTRVIIFKGRFETPRAAVKAAAEFLLPKNHSALVEQLRKAVEKL